MPYKPKFCCQCGDKIDRIDWKFISSRRFCELCETEFKIYDLLPRIALVCGILLSIFGLGSYLQKSGDSSKNVPKHLSGASLDLNKNSAKQAASPQISADQNVQSLAQKQANSSIAETKSQIAPLKDGLKNEQTEVVRTVTPEKSYFCGAQTKKGLPCSRKVKGGGRCWQHDGQPAMLPQEKLLAK